MRRDHQFHKSTNDQKYKGYLQRKILFEMRRNNLEVEDKVQEALMSLADTGSTTISRRVWTAGRAITKGRYLPLQRASLAQAERSIIQLFRLLAQESQRNGESLVSYQTFETVMSGICPLWPFC